MPLQDGEMSSSRYLQEAAITSTHKFRPFSDETAKFKEINQLSIDGGQLSFKNIKYNEHKKSMRICFQQFQVP